MKILFRNFGKYYMHSQLVKNFKITITECVVDGWKTCTINHVMYLNHLDTLHVEFSKGGPHSLDDSESGYFTVIKMN